MTSLWGSLSTAQTALQAQASYFSLISENLINARTPGYKAKDARFAELMASPDPILGSGALANSSSLNGTRFIQRPNFYAAGAITATKKDTDLAFSRGGMFVMADRIGNNPNYLLTANGSFQRLAVQRINTDTQLFGEQALTDFDTYITDSQGNYLLGWAYNPETQAFGSNVRSLSTLAPINIRQNVPYIQPAQATTSATVNYNIPASIENDGSTSFSFRIFDGSGTESEQDERVFIQQNWKRIDHSTWEMSFSQNPINKRGQFELDRRWTVRFDADGQLSTITDQTTGAQTRNGTINVLIPQIGPNNSNLPLSLDMSRVTNSQEGNVPDLVSLSERAGTEVDGNPYRIVEYQSMRVESNGDLIVRFSHNIEVPVARIPLASVANPDGLEELNGPVFQANSESGNIQLFDLSNSDRSLIYGGALAQSTTSFAREFTNMIQAQRSYNSATQTLRTIDEMIRTATQIKRA